MCLRGVRCEKITIRVVPETRLYARQQDVMVHDYGMTDGVLKVETRGALVQYASQSLHIDTSVVQLKPEVQQITVQNFAELEGYLFHCIPGKA